ncbi:DUF3150 domain-containing protein [Geopsychrobacter electrodiphilus]|uniref:DUF3150 domain-containing protein n=1 Tax=Geopsychrobacter electrodiphilus TaxID=225196 RepID=UPI000375FC0C|nr:DUF3150 domain-containing protein [Geopsychrobacter electrodiphilus]
MFDLLQKLICFSLDVHIWSGRKKLTPADLNLDGEEIPPEELASLGAKKICHPVLLSRFQALRRRAERICEAAGVRFLGGFAIPEEKAQEVARELEAVAVDFEAEKQEFLKFYAENMQAWLTNLPDRWRTMVEQAVESPEHVATRLSFGFQTFQVSGVEGLNSGLEKAANGLGDQLFREIGQASRLAWSQSFESRTRVSQKALRPIRSILEKAKGLVFVQPSLGLLITSIEQELDGLPKSGYMEGRDFHVLVGILNTLSCLDNINLNLAEEQKETEGSSDPEESTLKEDVLADHETENVSVASAQNAATEVDVEQVFEPIPEPHQRQTSVTSPVVWF